MFDPFIDRARRVLALVDIADAVDRFQRGETNVDETLGCIIEAVTRVTVDERHRPAA